MSQKNEAPVLALSLLITFGLIGSGLWLFREPVSKFFNQTSNPIRSQSLESSSTGGYAALAEVQGVPDGLFSYGGSTTWAPIRKTLDPVIQTVWPRFQLRYTDPTIGAPGSGSGIRMLLAGQLAFSQSSRALKEEEYQSALQRGFSLKQIPVAIDGIAIAVNPSLNLPGVTVAQLKDIYTNQITNWSQVGGPNLPITAYSRRPEEGGTVEFFVDNVLDGDDFGRNVTFIPTTTEALRQVATDSGGVYYASAPEIVPQCTIIPLPIGRTAEKMIAPYQAPLVSPDACPAQRNQLNAEAFQNGDYPITRRLFVIVKQNGQPDQQAGEAYAELILTSQAQELLKQAGFVGIR
ncbi:MAG: PstS family phosphate ABC transporter substrate-binding protein [Cyanothece sp. SIO1E1]|nr:PstS family phosphate ABC transporter substrate-binding protein [Cyanothece sp. SIO1E1]